MLGVMATAFAVIATLFICMIWNASKRDADVDRLLDEVEREDKKEVPAKKPSGEVEQKADWEKDGDWWKPQ